MSGNAVGTGLTRAGTEQNRNRETGLMQAGTQLNGVDKSGNRTESKWGGHKRE